MRLSLSLLILFIGATGLRAQKINDSTTPLHLMAPNYDTPYGKPEVKSITVVLDRIYSYLDQTTPMALIDKASKAELTDYSKIDVNTIFKPGDFRLLSYEWGVTYAGMLLASQATGDPKYASYTKSRLKFLAEVAKAFAKFEESHPGVKHGMYRTRSNGQVEGTCVGTGMGFDPAFYYYRPINVYAAHGYGPVLPAGAEMIEMVKNHKIEINDSAVQLYETGK